MAFVPHLSRKQFLAIDKLSQIYPYIYQHETMSQRRLECYNYKLLCPFVGRLFLSFKRHFKRFFARFGWKWHRGSTLKSHPWICFILWLFHFRKECDPSIKHIPTPFFGVALCHQAPAEYIYLKVNNIVSFLILLKRGMVFIWKNK